MEQNITVGGGYRQTNHISEYALEEIFRRRTDVSKYPSISGKDLST